MKTGDFIPCTYMLECKRHQNPTSDTEYASFTRLKFMLWQVYFYADSTLVYAASETQA
jgi:hypothetical protein